MREESLLSLEALDPKKQLAFALLIFERMLPSLKAFSKDTGFDGACYLQARDAAWAALENSVAGRASGKALSQTCLRMAPDTEKFSHDLTSFALNAALAMSDIAEFMLDYRVDHIADISTLARDSVYLYLGSLDLSVATPPDEDSKIASHPLMRQEENLEEEDIRFLSDLPDDFNKTVISALKERARNQAPLFPLAH